MNLKTFAETIDNDIYNIKQIDFPEEIRGKGICIYVSIFSAYMNIFDNDKNKLIEIIRKHSNKDSGKTIINYINAELKKNIFKLNIYHKTDELQTLYEKVINKKHLALGYSFMFDDCDHMIHVIYSDDEYLYYVENANFNAVYDDTLKAKTLNEFQDITIMSDDIKNKSYYNVYKDEIIKIRNDIVNIMEYRSNIVKFAKYELINESFKSNFIQTINIKDFLSVFQSYYLVDIIDSSNFSTLTNRLNDIGKPDLRCHRHVTWEMIQKEMQKIYDKYIKK